MSYTRNPTWRDYPDESTPIGAAQLEHIEGGIENAASTADSALAGLSTHTHTASQVTDFDAAVGTKVDVATINSAFGATGGLPIKPWIPPATIGPELATSGNLYPNGGAFSNLATTPSLSLTGSSASKSTRLIIVPSGDYFYRLAFDYDFSTVTTGWWEATIAWKNTADTYLTGDKQAFIAFNTESPKTGRFVFDLEYPVVENGQVVGLEIAITYWNNVASGTGTISNVSMKARAGAARVCFYTGQATGGVVDSGQAFMRHHWDVNERRWYLSMESFGKLSNTYQYGPIVGYSDIFPWNNRQVLPDPSFAQASVANADARTGATSSSTKTTATEAPIRASNNDQIFIAQPQAGGAFEYRGNVHGGETLNGSVVARVHNDDGWVDVTSEIDQQGAIPARRFQWTWPTKITSTGDATPFVNVTHLFTSFPDGVTRCDRTSTFARDTNISGVFEWMSSYDTSLPKLGRSGRGNDVTGSIDAYTHVAVPAAPTVTPATTGGTLAAGTYSYRVSAVTPLGETAAGLAATGTTTGSTSKNTVSWSAVTNATGYRIYGRTAGVEALLATVGAVTSWVDDGSTGGTALPPAVDTGRVIGSRALVPPVVDDRATWACWYDPISGWAHGNIYDREAILTRSAGVDGSKAALVSLSGIVKNYNTLSLSAASVTVPNGTVWSATHWSMVWRPEDPRRFHHEIAVRAASLTALKSVYPNT